MPIRRRRYLLATAVAAGLAVTATGCAEQSAALRVDDETVSRSAFEDELEAFADIYQGTVTGSLGDSYSQEYAGNVMNQRIAFILIERIFDDEGLELTDADRDEASDQVQDALDGMPADLRDEVLDAVARQIKLEDELGGNAANVALVAAYDAADIEVNPHYGSWDAEQRIVVPPPGPEPARGG